MISLLPGLIPSRRQICGVGFSQLFPGRFSVTLTTPGSDIIRGACTTMQRNTCRQLARGFLNVGDAPPCGEPIPSRSNPSEAVEIADPHGSTVKKIAPPESGAYALAGGDGQRDSAVQLKNAQGPSWFHRRPKGSTSLIAGNRPRPSGIGAVGGSLSAALD